MFNPGTVNFDASARCVRERPDDVRAAWQKKEAEKAFAIATLKKRVTDEDLLLVTTLEHEDMDAFMRKCWSIIVEPACVGQCG